MVRLVRLLPRCQCQIARRLIRLFAPTDRLLSLLNVTVKLVLIRLDGAAILNTVA